MKKFICLLLSVLTLFSIGSTALAESGNPASSGKAEILFEANTGQILYSKNADAKLPIASVTKTMSLLLFAEAIDKGKLTLEEKVKASGEAAKTEGSTIWLTAGEEMTVAELLEAVIVNSANDACVALAERVSGSEATFVKLMNKRAKELKMTSTRYKNCTGLDVDGHYSSAHDTAVVTAELMRHEVLRGWFLTWVDYLRGGETQLVNTNKMIRYYNGILGGKTGTTDAAGCCLTVCAERNNMRLVAVTLGCAEDSERFDVCESLLDYGFSSFELFSPEINFNNLKPKKVTRGTLPETTPIIKNQGEECVIKKGRAKDVKYEYTFVEQLEAPVEKGQFVGEYLVTVDGAEVFRSDIVAKDDIPRMNFWICFVELLRAIISM